MYVCIDIYIYMQMYMCMQVYMYVYQHVYVVHVPVCIYIHMRRNNFCCPQTLYNVCILIYTHTHKDCNI